MNVLPHGRLTTKQRSVVRMMIERLYSPKAWADGSASDVLSAARMSNLVRLDSGHQWVLSKVGHENFTRIVATLADADYFLGLATYSDIWNACNVTLGKLLSDQQQPDTPEEFIELVHARIADQVDVHTFIVSIYGVVLKDLDAFDLGRVQLVKPSEAYVLERGVVDHHGTLPMALEQMGMHECWLIGSYRGTRGAATREAFHQFRLCAGLLAVSAASTFESGAQAFRIGAATSPEDGRVAVNVMLGWEERKKFLIYTRQWRKGQAYEVTPALSAQLREAPVFAKMLVILQNVPDTELKRTIVRAVYWFADAHTDSVGVMRLVKFWSCIESFFSIGERVTEAVSLGTAVVLAFGPFGFVNRSDYGAVRKRLAALYGKRSKAVHHGHHDHVDNRDLADLSQWAAWLILSMAELSGSYSTPKQILAHSESIHAAASKGGPDA